MGRAIENLVFSAVLIAVPMTAVCEVNFPKTRNAVGPDETYILEEFGVWDAECVRDRDSEDTCHATTSIADLDEGLELYFDVVPYLEPLKPTDADVDVVPRAGIVIAPFSGSDHYKHYSAAITHIDGERFDGYWCPLTDDSDCNQGPELASNGLAALLGGRRATITIFDREATAEEFVKHTSMEVDLRSLRKAFLRANEFTLEIFGIGTDETDIPTEICSLYDGGAEKRISYTFDEDYESEVTSLRETVRGSKGKGTCPSYVTLAYFTPDMTTAQRDIFCLVYDEDREEITGFQPGIQNAYRVCKDPTASFCARVNESKDAALAVVGFGSGAVGSAVGATTVAGTTVVAHSSGAVILTGSSGYVAGTLGTIGTSALGVLTAPATVTAAAVSVVAVGSAVYVCSE